MFICITRIDINVFEMNCLAGAQVGKVLEKYKLYMYKGMISVEK